ncbi:YqgE/AlgH family protein [Parvibaculaceae bacterium PLY_AMNH_Bact1]|nr:YqgE/AlgH family protein [Parvibaculaceae bacterium PLY_AMNH_Bact1]
MTPENDPPITPSNGSDADQYLEGKMLIAMPTMGDDRFARTLIYMCAHSDEGAMGLIVNKVAPSIEFPELLEQLDIQSTGSVGEGASAPAVPVLQGGPVEAGRGFVLHSHDYHQDNATLPISDHISMTATVDVLKAIARGAGPHKAMLALGYAGWAPGQLEHEIQANGWLHCEADDELLFGDDVDAKYDQALAKLGVDISFLSGDAGHA